jgi:hypothetical protein
MCALACEVPDASVWSPVLVLRALDRQPLALTAAPRTARSGVEERDRSVKPSCGAPGCGESARGSSPAHERTMQRRAAGGRARAHGARGRREATGGTTVASDMGDVRAEWVMGADSCPSAHRCADMPCATRQRSTTRSRAPDADGGATRRRSAARSLTELQCWLRRRRRAGDDRVGLRDARRRRHARRIVRATVGVVSVPLGVVVPGSVTPDRTHRQLALRGIRAAWCRRERAASAYVPVGDVPPARSRRGRPEGRPPVRSALVRRRSRWTCRSPRGSRARSARCGAHGRREHTALPRAHPAATLSSSTRRDRSRHTPSAATRATTTTRRRDRAVRDHTPAVRRSRARWRRGRRAHGYAAGGP